ncbi:cyclodeaminase/cyclohydrolase family protein [Facklamia sp. DSM 111018]|uniref:Cyclodeaminase/cyclohydrolase family protein n=1 Tax=Facklamia lactis TaxID=2749967 RepID=A0ABS0LRJ3_9LACT|nr:cyclodeaminase/cyclohydrolase family protein [Facklamia lactis]MBG9980859.1 cyclodeaminase/cyclohydrolase family protein [Facklamia lactis]MBG9986778.1 cyclodeaminase/cyclohydrolase family protein [Facklamia lactis]
MKELKVTEFINQLASDAPTPGGGAAAGVTAGLGVGAILMAMIFSKNKKMSEQEHEFLLKKIEDFEKSKQIFIEIIDRDASEFEPLSKAYGMPKATDEEIAARNEAMEEGLKIASRPPIDLLNEVEKILTGFEEVIPLIKKMIISDVGVGLQMLRSAIHASSLNLYINGGQIKDEAVKQEYFDLANNKVADLSAKADALYAQVKEILVP